MMKQIFQVIVITQLYYWQQHYQRRKKRKFSKKKLVPFSLLLRTGSYLMYLILDLLLSFLHFGEVGHHPGFFIFSREKLPLPHQRVDRQRDPWKRAEEATHHDQAIGPAQLVYVRPGHPRTVLSNHHTEDDHGDGDAHCCEECCEDRHRQHSRIVNFTPSDWEETKRYKHRNDGESHQGLAGNKPTR